MILVVPSVIAYALGYYVPSFWLSLLPIVALVVTTVRAIMNPTWYVQSRAARGLPLRMPRLPVVVLAVLILAAYAFHVYGLAYPK